MYRCRGRDANFCPFQPGLVQALFAAVLILWSTLGLTAAHGLGTAEPQLHPSAMFQPAPLPAAPSSQSGAPAALHILFHSIPLPGHVNPLLAQAAVLAERGYRVTVATPTSLQSYVLANKHPHVQYLPAGDCLEHTAEFPRMIERVSQNPSFAEGSHEIFDWIHNTHPCMYRALVDALNGTASTAAAQRPSNLAFPVDLMVIDATTIAGFDAAATLGLPFVVNNADLLYLLSPRVLPPALAQPVMFMHKSLHSITTAFWERLLLPAVHLLVHLHSVVNMGGKLDALRADQPELRTRPVDVYRVLAGHVVLQNTAFGLEYPRVLSPLVHLVGPCVQPAQDQGLSPEDELWLQGASSKPAASTTATSTPVAFVSMGTLAPLSFAQTKTLLRGLLTAGLADGRLRVLWKLAKGQAAADLQRAAAEIAADGAAGTVTATDAVAAALARGDLRVTTWVSSQLGVLSHPATRLFVSHCGVNSAHEAVLVGGGRLQTLCIPMFGDQFDMAQRVRDAGVGMFVDKLTMTADQVADGVTALLRMSRDPVWIARGTAAKRAVQLAGGVQRAADIIEYTAHGHRDLVRASAAAAFTASAASAATTAAPGHGLGIDVLDVSAETGRVTLTTYVSSTDATGAGANPGAAGVRGAGGSTAPGAVGLWTPVDVAWDTCTWYGVDVLGAWFLITVALALLLRTCCRCCCRCCGGGRGSKTPATAVAATAQPPNTLATKVKLA